MNKEQLINKFIRWYNGRELDTNCHIYLKYPLSDFFQSLETDQESEEMTEQEIRKANDDFDNQQHFLD